MKENIYCYYYDLIYHPQSVWSCRIWTREQTCWQAVQILFTISETFSRCGCRWQGSFKHLQQKSWISQQLVTRPSQPAQAGTHKQLRVPLFQHFSMRFKRDKCQQDSVKYFSELELFCNITHEMQIIRILLVENFWKILISAETTGKIQPDELGKSKIVKYINIIYKCQTKKHENISNLRRPEPAPIGWRVVAADQWGSSICREDGAERSV